MFDEQDTRYKCCCGHTHVKTGALIIIVVECIGVVMTLIAALAGSGGGAIDILGTVIGVAIIILLIYAMKKENAVFVLPHLVFQGIIVVALVVVAIGHMSDAMSITGKMDEALETKSGGGINATPTATLSNKQQQQIIAYGRWRHRTLSLPGHYFVRLCCFGSLVFLDPARPVPLLQGEKTSGLDVGRRFSGLQPGVDGLPVQHADDRIPTVIDRERTVNEICMKTNIVEMKVM